MVVLWEGFKFYSFLKMLGHVKNKYVKEFPLFNESLSFLLGKKGVK